LQPLGGQTNRAASNAQSKVKGRTPSTRRL